MKPRIKLTVNGADWCYECSEWVYIYAKMFSLDQERKGTTLQIKLLYIGKQINKLYLTLCTLKQACV